MAQIAHLHYRVRTSHQVSERRWRWLPWPRRRVTMIDRADLIAVNLEAAPAPELGVHPIEDVRRAPGESASAPYDRIYRRHGD